MNRTPTGGRQNLHAEGDRMNTTLKKALTSALVASMVLGASAAALATGPSKDDRTHRFGDWQQIPDYAQEALSRMAVKGVMMGDAEGFANPSHMITNAEAAAMVIRFMGQADEAQAVDADAELESELNVEDEGDIPSWARQIVALALKSDLFDLQNGRFSPQHPLTRLEAAKLLVKAAQLEDEATSKMDATLPFKDAKQIPAEYSGYVAVVYDHGWMVGDPNGMFHPWKAISRAEWATLLNRVDTSTDVGTDENQIKGSLTAVTVGDAPSISLTTPVFPGGVTYPVDDTCVFLVNGKEATIADLQVGDSVIINLSQDRKVLAVAVVVKKESVSGVVSAVTAATVSAPASISLQGSSTVTDAVYGGTGAAATYEVLASATVKVGDVAGTLADVKVGDKVELTLERGKVTAIKVDVEVESFTGEVTAVTQGTNNQLPSIAVIISDTGSQTFQVADYAQILSATGANITMNDVKVGDRVELRAQRSLVIRVKVLAADAADAQTNSHRPDKKSAQE